MYNFPDICLKKTEATEGGGHDGKAAQNWNVYPTEKRIPLTTVTKRRNGILTKEEMSRHFLISDLKNVLSCHKISDQWKTKEQMQRCDCF